MNVGKITALAARVTLLPTEITDVFTGHYIVAGFSKYNLCSL